MEGLKKITRVQVLQNIFYMLYEESRKDADIAVNEDAARRDYGMMTGNSPAGVGAAHYAAFCNGVIKGLQLTGRLDAGEKEGATTYERGQRTCRKNC